MGFNLGGYLGLAKETTPGTAVPATAWLTIQKLAAITSKVPPIEVEDYSQFGTGSVQPGLESVEGSATVYVTPKGIGHLLAQLLGLPTTTGTTPNYVHAFKPLTAVPAYTWEAKDGVTVQTGAGMRVSELTFEHDPQGLLTVSVSAMGLTKATGATPTVPVIETQTFNASKATITLGGTNLSGKIEKLSLGLKLGKEAQVGFGSTTISDVQPTGEAEVTGSFTLRYDSVDRMAAFKQMTGQALTITWALDVNTSLTINLPTVVFTDDPMIRQNDDLGIARVSLAIKAVNFGNATIATVKNGQASY